MKPEWAHFQARTAAGGSGMLDRLADELRV